MMTKLFGSVLILLACCGFGYCKTSERKTELRQLEELNKIFHLLKSDMQYFKVPFAELFTRLANKTDGVYREWLLQLSRELEEKGSGTFQMHWETSIQKLQQQTYLSKSVVEELLRLGTSLNYCESITLFLERLEQEMEQTRKEYDVKKKLYRSLSVLGGIFLVVVLL